VVGLRNPGKSSVIHTLFEKEVSIVSSVPGTTTDPVTRKMELPGWGPVAFVDTAGIDDEGELGRKRLEKTGNRLATASAHVFVTAANRSPEPAETELINKLLAGGKPLVFAVTHGDLPVHGQKQAWLDSLAAKGLPYVLVDNNSRTGGAELRRVLAALAQKAVFEAGPLDGLVNEGDHLLLVVPIDLAAPRGRLIQPQVETIRDALDRDCRVTVVKERELYEAYRSFTERPKLVITDSQVFAKVSADTPRDILLTSFSILLARYKGFLEEAVKGAAAIERLRDGDLVLISEGCTHHRQCDDIGRVKLPRWIRNYTQKQLEFEFSSGGEFPEDLSKYSLIVHCGGCMLNEREVKYRQKCAQDQNVPITNYGISIAYMQGILKRSIEMFPHILAEIEE
jgi:[FeFe] hydrogenase H-cluster maturation GTPase HydF